MCIHLYIEREILKDVKWCICIYICIYPQAHNIDQISMTLSVFPQADNAKDPRDAFPENAFPEKRRTPGLR